MVLDSADRLKNLRTEECALEAPGGTLPTAQVSRQGELTGMSSNAAGRRGSGGHGGRRFSSELQSRREMGWWLGRK